MTRRRHLAATLSAVLLLLRSAVTAGAGAAASRSYSPEGTFRTLAPMLSRAHGRKGGS